MVSRCTTENHGTPMNALREFPLRSLLLAEYGIERDYTFTVGEYHFGFVDAEHTFGDKVTLLQLGPLGHFHHVPFSAAQGWVLVGLVLAMTLAAIGLLGVKLRRKVRGK